MRALLQRGGETPGEIARSIAAFESLHGPTTHTLFRFGPDLVATHPVGGYVAVLHDQPVVPCGEDAAPRVPVAPDDGVRSHPARDLPYLAHAYVLLSCLTQDPADRRVHLRAQKIGASRAAAVQAGGVA